ncbi:MAG: hypothetical protein KDM63_10085, partial [Verrucomicrobiae bacterium]|nr:hypothetical protein [Verrucomicrobiae bacterium]
PAHQPRRPAEAGSPSVGGSSAGAGAGIGKLGESRPPRTPPAKEGGRQRAGDSHHSLPVPFRSSANSPGRLPRPDLDGNVSSGTFP